MRIPLGNFGNVSLIKNTTFGNPPTNLQYTDLLAPRRQRNAVGLINTEVPN